MKYINKVNQNQKSVQSVHPCKSVIQTYYDIVKAHGGVPMAIGMKVETKEGEGSELIIYLPIN